MTETRTACAERLIGEYLERTGVGAADRAILRADLEGVMRHLELAGRIETAWTSPSAQASTSWRSHEDIGCEDINSVMLAASLLAGSDAPHARRLLRRLSSAP